MNNSNDTASSLLRLCGRKHKAKLGADLNESVATGPSAFARAQLEKLGWTEGTGLGKNRDGRASHIRVTKRREGQAIGAASTEIDPVVTGDQWWKSSVGNTLARLAEANKKKKSSKKKKKEKKLSKKRKIEYTDEELFEATGGARFGMRAQTQQRGKWNRAEDAITKDEEEKAISNTEWDGMAAPKIVLSSSEKKKKRTKSTNQKEAIDESSSESSASKKDTTEDSSSSKPPKRKKRKISLQDENVETDVNTKKEKTKKEKKSKKSKKKKKGIVADALKHKI
jgi:Pin2-interacting protein X1